MTINFSGRFIDQTAVGLSMLLGKMHSYPNCLFSCLTGRPFQYQITDNADFWLTPHLSFVNAILHAIQLLGIQKFAHFKIIDSSKITNCEYSISLTKLLSFSPVLIGPFSGKLFENEFIHAFRRDPSHCLLCVSSINGEYLLLHPDGLLIVMSTEQLISLHKRTNSVESIMISINTHNTLYSTNELSKRALCSGAKLVSKATQNHGSAAFLKAIISKRIYKKDSVMNEIKFRLGLSELSINTHMINELAIFVSKCLSDSTSSKYKIQDLIITLNNVQKECSTLLALPNYNLPKNGTLFSDFLRSWINYEYSLVNLSLIICMDTKT